MHRYFKFQPSLIFILILIQLPYLLSTNSYLPRSYLFAR